MSPSPLGPCLALGTEARAYCRATAPTPVCLRVSLSHITFFGCLVFVLYSSLELCGPVRTTLPLSQVETVTVTIGARSTRQREGQREFGMGPVTSDAKHGCSCYQNNMKGYQLGQHLPATNQLLPPSWSAFAAEGERRGLWPSSGTGDFPRSSFAHPRTVWGTNKRARTENCPHSAESLWPTAGWACRMSLPTSPNSLISAALLFPAGISASHWSMRAAWRSWQHGAGTPANMPSFCA